MTTRTLADIAKKLRKIDITMLSTHTEGGQIAGRPMSNNGDVEYDGDSYYFTMDSTRMVRDIAGDPRVSLGFTGSKGFHVAVQGQAELIRDRAAFAEHWNPDLDRWFADGIDTPGLTMIKVHATRIHYWDGEDNGEITV
jgi:general stress protein 26